MDSPTITLAATATDSDGPVASVAFYDGPTLIGNGTRIGTSNNYQLSWNPGPGVHTLTAIAVDNLGRSGSSDAVGILVNGIEGIAITSPANNSSLSPSASITISATTTVPSSSIQKVEFFANSISLGQGVFTGPTQCSITWNEVVADSYTLSAVLTNLSGVISISEPVTVNVSKPPTVVITNPVSGTRFSPIERLSLNANAKDDDGYVGEVSFFANGVLIGAGFPVGNDNYAFDWTNIANGMYTITAVATDNIGVKTTSAPVHISVNSEGSFGDLSDLQETM